MIFQTSRAKAELTIDDLLPPIALDDGETELMPLLASSDAADGDADGSTHRPEVVVEEGESEAPSKSLKDVVMVEEPELAGEEPPEDDTPVYMKNRSTVDTNLESTWARPSPFDEFAVYRGQTKGQCRPFPDPKAFWVSQIAKRGDRAITKSFF